MLLRSTARSLTLEQVLGGDGLRLHRAQRWRRETAIETNASAASFLQCYLFVDRTQVNDSWTRSTDTTRQFRTQAQVSGKRGHPR